MTVVGRHRNANRRFITKSIHPIAASTIAFSEHLAETQAPPVTIAIDFGEIKTIEQPERTNSTKIQVWREDTFRCARRIIEKELVTSGEIVVLSMCSEYQAGGGFLKGFLAQEESLCRRSNLHQSLTAGSFYPMKPDTLLYTHGVTVFREDDSDDFYKPKDLFSLNVISAAAIRHPVMKNNDTEYAKCEDKILMETKVRAVLRIAHNKSNKVIVLGAWGAGAFGHSPEAISVIFKNVLAEDEFINVFDMIVFAVIDSRSTNNYSVFKAAFPQIKE